MYVFVVWVNFIDISKELTFSSIIKYSRSSFLLGYQYCTTQETQEYIDSGNNFERS